MGWGDVELVRRQQMNLTADFQIVLTFDCLPVIEMCTIGSVVC